MPDSQKIPVAPTGDGKKSHFWGAAKAPGERIPGVGCRRCFGAEGDRGHGQRVGKGMGFAGSARAGCALIVPGVDLMWFWASSAGWDRAELGNCWDWAEVCSGAGISWPEFALRDKGSQNCAWSFGGAGSLSGLAKPELGFGVKEGAPRPERGSR